MDPLVATFLLGNRRVEDDTFGSHTAGKDVRESSGRVREEIVKQKE